MACRILLKSFFIWIVLFFKAYSQQYVPLEKYPEAFPNYVTLKNDLAIAYYDKYTASIPFDNKYNRFIADILESKTISILPKDNVILVTIINKISDKYHTSIYRNKDLTLPQKGDYFKGTPNSDNFFISSPEIISSYPFWYPSELSHAYSLISYKERGIIRMFPYVIADISNRICKDKVVSQNIFHLLAEQGVGCKDLIKAFDNIVLQNHLKSFQKKIDKQREMLIKVLECGMGLRHAKNCEQVTKIMAKQSMEIQTVRDVISKFY